VHEETAVVGHSQVGFTGSKTMINYKAKADKADAESLSDKITFGKEEQKKLKNVREKNTRSHVYGRETVITFVRDGLVDPNNLR